LALIPRQIIVIYHADSGIPLSDGGATVRLLKPGGQIADAFTYPVVPAADVSWCRFPDGTGMWAFLCYSSPGKPNTPLGPGTPAPGSTPEEDEPETAPACLSFPIPQPVRSAECDSPGIWMWGETDNGITWLGSRWKFDIYVK
jgi:hypothetical protein